MKIEKATKIDANDLTKLTIRSKSHWGYSKEQIDSWRDVLTVSESYIDKKAVYKLTEKNTIIGYYSYFIVGKFCIKLENLFIDPKFIKCGNGKILIHDFILRVKKQNFKRIVLDSDPNAEKFYVQMGFKTIGKLETSIKNRFLPIMEMYL